MLNFYNPALGSGVPGADLHIFTCMTTHELWEAMLPNEPNELRDALRKAKTTRMRYFRFYQEAAQGMKSADFVDKVVELASLRHKLA